MEQGKSFDYTNGDESEMTIKQFLTYFEKLCRREFTYLVEEYNFTSCAAEIVGYEIGLYFKRDSESVLCCYRFIERPWVAIKFKGKPEELFSPSKSIQFGEHTFDFDNLEKMVIDLAKQGKRKIN